MESKIDNEEFTKILLSQKNIYEKNEMIRYIIIKNYHKFLDKKYDILRISIINDIEDDIIYNLVNNNYIFTDDDIKSLIEKTL